MALILMELTQVTAVIIQALVITKVTVIINTTIDRRRKLFIQDLMAAIALITITKITTTTVLSQDLIKARFTKGKVDMIIISLQTGTILVIKVITTDMVITMMTMDEEDTATMTTDKLFA
ncbi:MAG: hypothetical protein ABL933_15155 [Methyloglobulus sp.]